jgi:hypothetical protein
VKISDLAMSILFQARASFSWSITASWFPLPALAVDNNRFGFSTQHYTPRISLQIVHWQLKVLVAMDNNRSGFITQHSETPIFFFFFFCK